MSIIEWCNTNEGFVAGLLSLLTLIVSVIAIVVSINTSRLPFKKKLKLSMTTNFLFEKNVYNNNVNSRLNGYTINVTNLGNRDINITYLGFGCMKKRKMCKAFSVHRDFGGKGIIHPTETNSVDFSKSEFLGAIENRSSSKSVFIIAEDSENKIYKKRIGSMRKLYKNNVDL